MLLKRDDVRSDNQPPSRGSHRKESREPGALLIKAIADSSHCGLSAQQAVVVAHPLQSVHILLHRASLLQGQGFTLTLAKSAHSSRTDGQTGKEATWQQGGQKITSRYRGKHQGWVRGRVTHAL